VLASIRNTTVILGAIYGPNLPDLDFYTRLEAALVNLGNYPVVIGGDFNTTYSPLPLESNKDVLNMLSLTNWPHSKALKKFVLDKN
jgi:hypothetical protein